MEAPAAPAALASPLVAEAAELLAPRTLSLGNLIASERAVEYVAILRAFVAFRSRHEGEPLHEDLEDAVCGEDATSAARTAFKADMRQLKEWGIVFERIEKERLRGYRDVRRTKYRYRACDDAIAFVEWLAQRREADRNPGGADETGNLLDIQRSLLAELLRMFKKFDPRRHDADLAGDILYRVDRMDRNVASTVKALGELNLRLLSFGAAEFGVDEAKSVVRELGVFLERFGRRFNEMREDILRSIAELRRSAHAARWRSCVEAFGEEAHKFKHIAAVRIPDAAALLADAEAFYAAGGTLIGLMSRVGNSARRVWGRLNTRLCELERRNHRLEDIGARLAELVRLGADEVPHAWFGALFEAAVMHGDAQVRSGGEKAIAPKPKKSSHNLVRRLPDWIVPRKVGDKPDVVSCAEARARELKEWMRLRGILPDANAPVRLSSGAWKEFGDFPNLMRLIESLRLGSGEKTRTVLGVNAEPCGESATVELDSSSLSFEDLSIKKV